MSNAWLLLASGDAREYRGNDGYEDEVDSSYRWDSQVRHHSKIQVGDKLVIRDKDALLGVSVVEEIETGPGQKVQRRCPDCDTTRIKVRSKLTPVFRCFKGHLFDSPKNAVIDVTTYASRHDAAWVSMLGVLSGKDLRHMCHVSPLAQDSIRPFDWDTFTLAVGDGFALGRVELRTEQSPDGHTQTLTRARVGQGAFRTKMLAKYGQVCVITGPAPESVLEAAHLYSYAELGVHHDDGGLLLRRDLHRLFDDGGIVIDPKTLAVDVAESLQSYPEYQRLHGAPVQADLGNGQRRWLRKHHSQHRSGGQGGPHADG
mgnify:CR=1 FL=1|jgi:hypothetical protein